LVAYFLGNICAENCRNRTVYVKVIASGKGGTFFETRCSVSQKYCQQYLSMLDADPSRSLYSLESVVFKYFSE